MPMCIIISNTHNCIVMHSCIMCICIYIVSCIHYYILPYTVAFIRLKFRLKNLCVRDCDVVSGMTRSSTFAVRELTSSWSNLDTRIGPAGHMTNMSKYLLTGDKEVLVWQKEKHRQKADSQTQSQLFVKIHYQGICILILIFCVWLDKRCSYLDQSHEWCFHFAG